MIRSFVPAVSLSGDFDDINEMTQDSDVFRSKQAATLYVAGFPEFTYPDGLVLGAAYYCHIDEVIDADAKLCEVRGDWVQAIKQNTQSNQRAVSLIELSTFVSLNTSIESETNRKFL